MLAASATQLQVMQDLSGSPPCSRGFQRQICAMLCRQQEGAGCGRQGPGQGVRKGVVGGKGRGGGGGGGQGMLLVQEHVPM